MMCRFLYPPLCIAALLTPNMASADTVSVLYAGSLVNLMEHSIGPAFNKATGDTFQGFAAGSNALVNQIKGQLRRGDVFISANPMVNDSLTGAANGDWVSWYVNFAQSPLVIGYNPSSKFAADLKSRPWSAVMQEAGIRIGRTDPKLDPKGALTIQLLDHAEQVYNQPGLAQRILGAPENPTQVSLEETLVGRLMSGQLDIGFFYSTETSDLKIPSISLPREVSLSAHYTATVLRNAASPAGATRFVGFLLGAQGRALMQDHGLDIVKPSVRGDASKMPPQIRSEVDAAK
jgi:molybdate/tungstate transport system substrate-binding protein